MARHADEIERKCVLYYISVTTKSLFFVSKNIRKCGGWWLGGWMDGWIVNGWWPLYSTFIPLLLWFDFYEISAPQWTGYSSGFTLAQRKRKRERPNLPFQTSSFSWIFWGTVEGVGEFWSHLVFPNITLLLPYSTTTCVITSHSVLLVLLLRPLINVSMLRLVLCCYSGQLEITEHKQVRGWLDITGKWEFCFEDSRRYEVKC